MIHLPERGRKGSSHMPMMDRNNAGPADIIIDRIARQGLWK